MYFASTVQFCCMCRHDSHVQSQQKYCTWLVPGSSYFWIVLLGQFVASTSNSVFFGGAALLSEVWFPDSQRATATAIGAAIAPQVGIMIALGLSPVIVHSDLTDPVCNDSFSSTPEQEMDWRNFVFYRLLFYRGGVAIICVLVFVATVIGMYTCMLKIW